jgi:hypothetical protein
MDKKFPYQVLMETKGLTNSDLPTEVKNNIKKVESTLRSVVSFGKQDENGEYKISDTVKNKLDNLDKEIVDGIWDFLEEKQKQEGRTNASSENKVDNQEQQNSGGQGQGQQQQQEEQGDSKKESKGYIGFFEF